MRTLSIAYRDVRQAMRLMIKRPGFSAVAVLTLAAGMAGTLVAFTAVNALFVKALPVRDIERGGSIRITGRNEPGEGSFAELEAFSRDLPSMDVTAQMPWPLNLRVATGTEVIWALVVAPRYFEIVEMPPIAGRAFDASVDSPAVLISERFWRDRLASASLAGLTLNLSGFDVPVIGVLPDSPRGVGGFYDPKVWIRAEDWRAFRLPERLREPSQRPLFIFGRIKGDQTPAKVDSELRAVTTELARIWPDSNAGRSATFHLLGEADSDMRAVAAIASVAMVLVGLVLCIAIFNLTGLLLARAIDRRFEMAMRTALGASRWQLVQQFVIESLVLGVPAGLAALTLTVWSVNLLRAFALPSPIPLRLDVSPDATVIAFAATLTLLTGLTPGLLAAWKATASTHRPSRLRGFVVTIQIAGATIFLTGAALLVRNAVASASLEVGFERENALVVEFDPTTHGEGAGIAHGFVDDVARGVATLPGVRDVNVANRIPFYIGIRQRQDYSAGSAPCMARDCPSAALYRVGPHHFKTMGIPLAGRDFDGTAADVGSVIVSQTMARQISASGDVIGRQILLGREGRSVQIVGVAGDIVHRSLGERPDAHMYLAMDETSYRAPVTIVARTSGDPAPLVPAVRGVIGALDSAVAVNVRTMPQYLERATWLPATFARFFILCGAVALVLSVVGLVGTVWYSVAQRTREFGIRSALGAAPPDLRRLVIRGAIETAVPGVVVGLIAALGLMRLTAAAFNALDLDAPLLYLAVGVLQVLIVMAGTILPARVAGRVNPLVALRAE